VIKELAVPNPKGYNATSMHVSRCMSCILEFVFSIQGV
jgi:hypothetical protein